MCGRDETRAARCLAQSKTPHSRCPFPRTISPFSSNCRFHSVCAQSDAFHQLLSRAIFRPPQGPEHHLLKELNEEFITSSPP